jgi:GTP-binding protein Era
VVVDSVEEDRKTGFYRVAATIFVERQSQKGILIGEGGQVLKKIGMEARKDMERLTGGKVFLSLWVKVRKNWTRDRRSLREFGFD